MTYRVKNTAFIGKSYEASNGKRISFEPGEEKRLETRPPEDDGWEIEALDEKSDDEDKGGEE